MSNYLARSTRLPGSLVLAVGLISTAIGSIDLQAATITYGNIQQFRDPVGPASVPDLSLPFQLQLPTAVYESFDDDVSIVDEGKAEFNFSFEVDIEPGVVATGVALRQHLAI